jgi:hypothetical protein
VGGLLALDVGAGGVEVDIVLVLVAMLQHKLILVVEQDVV